MPLVIKNNNTKDFDPVPAGVHHAICYGVVDVGTQVNPASNFPPRPKVILLFELPYERIDIPDRGNLPRGLSLEQTQSLADKSNLRKYLKSWRGRDFTDKELEGFDIKSIIGANCQVNVVHKPGKGKDCR